MPEESFRLLTVIVVEGEPFRLPDGAIIISTEPRHWSMDGKARWRVVYLIRNG